AGVRLVGIDYLSVAAPSDPAPAHLALLRAGAVILEGLDLRAVAPGPYRLVCLPLRIEGADGAPARAVLIRD
ncbi:MAG: arylformamidase, partial [Miltoncostaeaceae bacterium]|nr:arylformamidase [Miltoncostaeaceae bacterium]